jgi:SRSO17 transposase
VPPDVGFATKSEIALTLIEQALADQVLPAPVLGDSAYGDGFAFRTRTSGLTLEKILEAIRPWLLRSMDRDKAVDHEGHRTWRQGQPSELNARKKFAQRSMFSCRNSPRVI